MARTIRAAIGAVAAGAIFLAMQSPVSANSEWIVTSEAIGAVNAGTLNDGWYQVYIENTVPNHCAYVQINYSGLADWIWVYEFGNNLNKLKDCSQAGTATLISPQAPAIFFRTCHYRPNGSYYCSDAKAVYDDH